MPPARSKSASVIATTGSTGSAVGGGSVDAGAAVAVGADESTGTPVWAMSRRRRPASTRRRCRREPGATDSVAGPAIHTAPTAAAAVAATIVTGAIHGCRVPRRPSARLTGGCPVSVVARNSGAGVAEQAVDLVVVDVVYRGLRHRHDLRYRLRSAGRVAPERVRGGS